MPNRGLTARERGIIDALAHGTKPKAIATDLGLSRSTVIAHLRNARLKLNALTVWHAVAIFAKEEDAERG